MQQHRRARYRKSSSGWEDREQQVRVHVCPRCKWEFPNAHPSSKKRAAHRKQCGKIEGYPLVGVAVPLDSDAESSLADSLHGGSGRMEARAELLLENEMRLESTIGDKGIKKLIESGHYVEADNQIPPDASNLGTPEPSGKADCKCLDSNVQLQDTAALISEEFKHGLESPCISEDRKFACITVPDDYVHTRNAVKPDSKPHPACEEKSESGVKPRNDLSPEHEIDFVDHAVDSSGPVSVVHLTVVADANMKRNSEENAPASFMCTDINGSGSGLGALERHQPVDSVALPISFSAEILKPDDHLDISKYGSIKAAETSVELQETDTIKPSSTMAQEKASRTIVSSDYDAANSDTGAKMESATNDASLSGTEGNSIGMVNGYGKKVKDNGSYTAQSMHLFTEHGGNEREKKQVLTDSTASGIGNIANEGRGFDDEDINHLQNGMIEYQEVRDNLRHGINTKTVQSEAQEIFEENELTEEAKLDAALHYQFSGDKLLTSEKEQHDAALHLLDALCVTTSKREISGDHCGSVHGPANKDYLEQLMVTDNENEMRTDSNIDANNKMEHSSYSTQDGREYESKGRKKSKIKSKVVTWKNVNDEILAESKKLHTPLKKLLKDETHGNKRRTTTQAHKLSPSREIISLREIYDGQTTKTATTEIEHSPVRVATRSMQKEWNSPARLPNTKNDKEKTKGKQQWVPFMCCPTTAI